MIFDSTENNLIRASRIVKKGKLIIYPTDTVYGLGCDPYNSKAIVKIFKLKLRSCKPLPVLCSSLEEVKKLVFMGKKELKLATKFWPGPLTIITKKKDTNLPSTLTCGSDKLAVRVPNHEVAKRLIDLCGGSLVGTSANISGLQSPTSAEEALTVFKKGFDVIINGGPTPIGKESTIVEFKNNSLILIREGAICKSKILSL